MSFNDTISIHSLLDNLFPSVPVVWMSFSVSASHFFRGLPPITLPTSIHYTSPSLANLLLFANLTMFTPLSKWLGSWFILRLPEPPLLWTGPRIVRRIFVSKIRSWLILDKVHPSNLYITVGHYTFYFSVQDFEFRELFVSIVVSINS